MKAVAGILGGLILALLAMSLTTITLAAGALEQRGTPPGIGVFIVTWVLAFLVAFKAPTASKAWRRLMLSSAVFSFLLPISGLVFTGSMLATRSSGSGAETAGTVIGGGLISGMLGFFGFFLGIAFLVIGLLVGRGNKVVYVQMVEGGPVPHPQAGGPARRQPPPFTPSSAPMMPAKRVAPIEVDGRMSSPMPSAVPTVPMAPDEAIQAKLQELRRRRPRV